LYFIRHHNRFIMKIKNVIIS